MSLTQKQRAAKLQRYRTEQSRIAIERDNYVCRRCGAAGCEVHHVHGRGNWRTREHYEHSSKLLTLCWQCHARCHRLTPLLAKTELIEILERVLEDA